MGMYTGMKVQAVIKNEYVDAMKKVLEDHDFVHLLPVIPQDQVLTLKSYMSLSRHDHVFSLVGSGKFDGYETGEYWNLEEEGGSRMDGNVLYAFASLKNYDDVIEQFVQTILPIIASNIVLAESWYEESSKPRKI